MLAAKQAWEGGDSPVPSLRLELGSQIVWVICRSAVLRSYQRALAVEEPGRGALPRTLLGLELGSWVTPATVLRSSHHALVGKGALLRTLLGLELESQTVWVVCHSVLLGHTNAPWRVKQPGRGALPRTLLRARTWVVDETNTPWREDKNKPGRGALPRTLLGLELGSQTVWVICHSAVLGHAIAPWR